MYLQDVWTEKHPGVYLPLQGSQLCAKIPPQVHLQMDHCRLLSCQNASSWPIWHKLQKMPMCEFCLMSQNQIRSHLARDRLEYDFHPPHPASLHLPCTGKNCLTKPQNRRWKFSMHDGNIQMRLMSCNEMGLSPQHHRLCKLKSC